MSDSQRKKKLIDVAVLSIATLTVIGMYYAHDSRIDALEMTVKDNTQWRATTENALEAIAKSMDRASARIDSAKDEILQQMEQRK